MLAAAAMVLALAVQPAPPVEVGRVGLGSSFGALVSSPDGGAWVHVSRSTIGLARGDFKFDDAIARATPEGGFSVTNVQGSLSGGVLGPDGRAWFTGGTSLSRSDTANRVTRDELSEPIGGLGDAPAIGPDGQLWVASTLAGTLSRVDAQLNVTRAPLVLPKCGPRPFLQDMKAASDGAMWIADAGCHRLVRYPLGGRPAVYALEPDERPVALAPDRAGGMWFLHLGFDTRIGHVTADGKLRRWTTPQRFGVPSGLAVGPDGTAYFAIGGCRLARIAPGGGLTYGPAPIPVQALHFDPRGGVWLVGQSRLVHASFPVSRGTCDSTPPGIRVSLSPRRRAPLAELRRGVRITVREPAVVSGTADYGNDDHDLQMRIVPDERGGTLVFRPPRSQLRLYERALDRGRRPRLSLYVEAEDRDGNANRLELERLLVSR